VKYASDYVEDVKFKAFHILSCIRNVILIIRYSFDNFLSLERADIADFKEFFNV